jgi:hypothetical protein
MMRCVEAQVGAGAVGFSVEQQNLMWAMWRRGFGVLLLADILFIGGLWAFVRTYQLWRERGTWWAWQGAGWFLLILMLLALTMGLPIIAGPAIGG